MRNSWRRKFALYGNRKIQIRSATIKPGFHTRFAATALRGTVEIVRDDETRRTMWQDSFIDHFPGGPTDPDYILLHFIGTEATILINGDFAREHV